MPRIRTLKPEHRQHRKVGKLSDRAYRLWVGMILEADDEGRLYWDADQIRLAVFGYHPKVTAVIATSLMRELESSGLIRLYDTVGGLPAIQIHDWDDHQPAKQSWAFVASRIPNEQGELIEMGAQPNDSARWAIYERDQFTCVYCKATLRQRMKEIALDHVVPVVLGGSHHPENLATCCRRCNIKKGGRTPTDAGLIWPDGLGRKAGVRRLEGVQTPSRERLDGPRHEPDLGVGPGIGPGTGPELNTHTLVAPPALVRVEPTDGFAEFWATWPSTRRVGKADAQKAWRTLHPDPTLRQIILAAVTASKQGPDWQREGGRYIPYPHRWLGKRRWEDAPPAAQATLLTEKTSGNQAAAAAVLRRYGSHA